MWQDCWEAYMRWFRWTSLHKTGKKKKKGSYYEQAAKYIWFNLNIEINSNDVHMASLLIYLGVWSNCHLREAISVHPYKITSSPSTPLTCFIFLCSQWHSLTLYYVFICFLSVSLPIIQGRFPPLEVEVKYLLSVHCCVLNTWNRVWHSRCSINISWMNGKFILIKSNFSTVLPST